MTRNHQQIADAMQAAYAAHERGLVELRQGLRDEVHRLRAQCAAAGHIWGRIRDNVVVVVSDPKSRECCVCGHIGVPGE